MTLTYVLSNRRKVKMHSGLSCSIGMFAFLDLTGIVRHISAVLSEARL